MIYPYFINIHTDRVSESSSYDLNRRWNSRVSLSRSQHISGHKPVRWAAVVSKDEPLLSSISVWKINAAYWRFINKREQYYIFARFHPGYPTIWFCLEK